MQAHFVTLVAGITDFSRRRRRAAARATVAIDVFAIDVLGSVRDAGRTPSTAGGVSRAGGARSDNGSIQQRFDPTTARPDNGSTRQRLDPTTARPDNGSTRQRLDPTTARTDNGSNRQRLEPTFDPTTGRDPR